MARPAELVVHPAAVSGSVAAQPSKSYTHRAFILSLLAVGRSTVRRPLIGEDTRATLEGVEAFGGVVERKGIAIEVTGGFLRVPEDVVNVRNSGTTLRLMSGVAALLPGATVFTGDGSIRGRPMQPLLDALNALGASCESLPGNGRAPVLIRGPMKGGTAALPGDISSQFISSLLISAPLAPGRTAIRLTTPPKSEPYIAITLEMLERFGVKQEWGATESIVEGNRSYSPADFTVPGDYSSAAFMLAAGALAGGRVTVRGLDPGSVQGDAAIVGILKKMGAAIEAAGDSVTVEGGHPLKAADVDCGPTPDLFPILCVLASQAKGRTVISGAEHLRFKESDRIGAMARALGGLGARVEPRDDGAVIRGPVKLKGGRVDSLGDHRILMASAVAGLVAAGPVRVTHPDCYRVSYPQFLNHLRKLGVEAK